jgi:peroxiredoxin
MKELTYILGILILAVAVGLNCGCEKKEQTFMPQTQSPQQKDSDKVTETEVSVASSAEQTNPLQPGASVESVSLKTVDGRTAELADFIEEKPTVLVFYRGSWCPYCNTHLAGLKEIEQQILDAGWQIIAVSPDRPEKLAESLDEHQMKYTLLSDSKMRAAKMFQIAFKVDDKTIEKYKGYGIDLTDASGRDHHLLPVPAVFLIGTDGVIQFTYANPDYKVRLDPQKILSKLTE